MSSALIRACEITPSPVSWLWQGLIPLEAITDIAGGPGQAKSSILYDLAARITTGRPMPGCTATLASANVILLQAEDHPASRVVPSLLAAGADLAKVHLVDRLKDGYEPLTFPDDMSSVEAAVADVKAKLLVLDPVSCYLKGSLQSEQCVRRALTPFVKLAERHHLAVVMVRHLRKNGSHNSVHLGAGSIAFVALARSSLLVGNDPTADDIHRHVLTLNKSNLASSPSLVYRTVQRNDGAIVVEWLGQSQVVAKDLALATGAASEVSALQEGMYVLYSLLCDGPLPVKEVESRAGQGGVTRRTLHRAKAALNVKSIKQGNGKGSRWYWKLPKDDRTYRAYKEHDMDCLMDQLCHGPSDIDIPASSTDLPEPRKPDGGDKDDGQLV